MKNTHKFTKDLLEMIKPYKVGKIDNQFWPTRTLIIRENLIWEENSELDVYEFNWNLLGFNWIY
jgi:hypothetical protein